MTGCRRRCDPFPPPRRSIAWVVDGAQRGHARTPAKAQARERPPGPPRSQESGGDAHEASSVGILLVSAVPHMAGTAATAVMPNRRPDCSAATGGWFKPPNGLEGMSDEPRPGVPYPHQQRRGAVPERLMCQPPRDCVAHHALRPALPAPRIRLGDSALDHRLTRLKALPDGCQTELIETAERGQTGRGEHSAEHVEVFRMGSVGRTSILVDLHAHPPTPPTSPSTAKSQCRVRRLQPRLRPRTRPHIRPQISHPTHPR